VGDDLAGIDRLAAAIAGEPRVALQPAGSVRVSDRRLGDLVSVTPGAERDENRVKREPLLRQAVLVTFWVLAVQPPIENVLLDEHTQPVAQQVARDAEAAPEVLVAADAEERLPDQEHRPALADHCPGLRDRAIDLIELVVPHRDEGTRVHLFSRSTTVRGMKIAYVFSTSGHTASYKLGKMILPQLEAGAHGVEVVGMMFFDDNTFVLRRGDPLGERLAKVAADQQILLMLCDRCALERSLAEGEPGACEPKDTVEGARVGCFPDLYAALAGNPPDHVITL